MKFLTTIVYHIKGMFNYSKKNEYKPCVSRKDYIQKTIDYCRKYAEFVALKDKVENGEMIRLSKDEMEQMIAELSLFRDEFLAEQKRMGYTSGENFLKNNSFRGFRILNGQLFGQSDCFYRIIFPWMRDYYTGESDNHFRFEIATLLYWLKEYQEEEQR